ncbi:sulfurtransferase [Ramlibacter albus]|uniref:tRNA uridine(34) hydroxylase n=1 Tax=Ramlibacter albus TaxID=2079448 RepID=A0A923S3G9_9BURK|nr:sulfurtransferase [Ramlibacter albus]MBC5766430.1 sulfurtransferase [Ramlibacter albus]
MPPVLNVAAYRFVRIDDTPALREALLHEAGRRGLRGTILLAGEGINLFLAGQEAPLREFIALLRQDARFEGLEVKESWSAEVPFGRLRVRIKREIIRMNHPAIQPAQGRAPAIDAPTVKRWLDAGHDDAGRPVVMLDTRNAFEMEHGTFEGALDWHLSKFSDFPDALQAHRAELEGKTVVSFCTGGIRCEKAALYMGELGLRNVWQLEGGILKYFEEAGGAHFNGTCFVFDEREALDPDLKPRTSAPEA